MGISMVAPDGRRLQVNVWNWGVLHHLVDQAELFSPEVWVGARWGTSWLEAPDVATLADFLSRQVLPRLRPGERMYFDGQTTDVPDDGTLYRDDLGKNYSLSREILAEIITFLEQAGGRVELL